MMQDINSVAPSPVTNTTKHNEKSVTASPLTLHHQRTVQYYFSQSLEEFRGLYSKLAQ
jgi:hypothetical protein